MPMRAQDWSIKSKDTGFKIKNLDAGRSPRPLMCQQVQLWSVGHATVLVKDMISISCCCWSPHSTQTDRHQLYGNPVPPGRHLIATPYQDPRDWVKFGFLSYFPRQTISSYSSSKRNWLRGKKRSYSGRWATEARKALFGSFPFL